MSRFLVFAGPTFYPSGGWGDFLSAHDAQAAAIAAADAHVLAHRDAWAHVVNLAEATRIHETESIPEQVLIRVHPDTSFIRPMSDDMTFTISDTGNRFADTPGICATAVQRHIDDRRTYYQVAGCTVYFTTELTEMDWR